MASVKLVHEMLSNEAIKMSIEPENLKKLMALDIFDVINSTNTYLLECAKSGMVSGSVCFSEQQSQGRGRQGKPWFSPRGANIYCSVLWYFSSDVNNLAALSLAVGVMIARVLKKYGVVTGAQLKWPNDILFAERKLGGVLIESLPAKNGNIAVVVGIGLNMDFTSATPDAAWIDLREITNQSPARNYFAGLLVNELLAGLTTYQQRGFESFIEEWRALNYLAGKSVVVKGSGEDVVGVMQGINLQGELMLQNGVGEELKFKCGEVSVRAVG
jgi:BirA family transcriptional regulator, biotin operon repressor / biotin---[acetyl-CoA-carboxylase] ligase